jgi:hypothetical protein
VLRPRIEAIEFLGLIFAQTTQNQTNLFMEQD